MTMDDLISRDAVIKTLNGGSSIRTMLGGVSGIWINLMDATDGILRIPAAKPVQHGMWEMRRKTINTDFATLTGTYPTCSLCGHVECGVEKSTPYCPGCGAKMDGDEK